MIHEGRTRYQGKEGSASDKLGTSTDTGPTALSLLVLRPNCDGEWAIQRERESIQGGRPRAGGTCGKGA